MTRTDDHDDGRTADDHARDERTLYECRHCGEKFQQPIAWCATCGSIEIARYTFPIEAGEPDRSGRCLQPST